MFLVRISIRGVKQCVLTLTYIAACSQITECVCLCLCVLSENAMHVYKHCIVNIDGPDLRMAFLAVDNMHSHFSRFKRNHTYR